MENNIPLRLRKEPMIEAVWEIRFASTKPSVADLLPGIMFQDLREKYPNITRLPAADIPALIAESDPKLRYVPKIRLEGGNEAVQIGEHVVSLNCRRPYSGWKLFSESIRAVVKTLSDTGLIDRLERFSLRYVNLIELHQPPSLSCLNLEMKMGGYEMDTRPVQLRTEIKEGDLIHIVQIGSPAEASIPGESGRHRGLLLDIDSIRQMRENESWPDIESQLDGVHLSSKKMFFGLLTPETTDKLGAEYEEGQS